MLVSISWFLGECIAFYELKGDKQGGRASKKEAISFVVPQIDLREIYI